MSACSISIFLRSIKRKNVPYKYLYIQDSNPRPLIKGEDPIHFTPTFDSNTLKLHSHCFDGLTTANGNKLSYNH